jgi:NMD protein affecting ribosome stability and mRNA decay
VSKCIDCGADIDTVGDNLRCGSCRQKKNYPNLPIGIQGWICPVCGAGLSPYTQRCPCMGFPPGKITC